MVKMIGFVLSLALLVTGFLGLTDVLPIFVTYPVLANIGAIVLGILSLLILIYAGRGGEMARQRKENFQQREENVQLRKESSDQSKREIEQLKKENEQQRSTLEQQASQKSSKKETVKKKR
jgi:cell shape-determining protein MreC